MNASPIMEVAQRMPLVLTLKALELVHATLDSKVMVKLASMLMNAILTMEVAQPMLLAQTQ